jgi:hypothetical protein
LASLLVFFGVASCPGDEPKYPAFQFRHPSVEDLAALKSNRVDLTRTILCKSDRAVAAGFVRNWERRPFGVDEIVSVTKESQISIWKVSLTKGKALGDAVEVVTYYGAAQDVFRNTWTIIGFGPHVIILQKTSPIANQTLVIEAHAGTFVYSTTGELTAGSLPSSSTFWGTCENE